MGKRQLPPEEPAEIHDVPLRDALEERYLAYALTTIMPRALPDARDGLKPVHRRILYGMRLLNLNPGTAFKKSAKIVGDVMGSFHPHGDQAIYDAMVRLAQDFSVRYPLVDGQGNFGNIDGDNPAAERYTEARMTALAQALLDGLDGDAADFKPNSDGADREPVVMPAAFPNLLVNGGSGIAVGMATSIPPHNLGEVCKGIVALLDNPKISIRELMEHMPGPDFPTGGIICGKAGIWKGYETGRSTVVVRSKTTIEKRKGDRYSIIINDIPYQQTRDPVIKKISDVANEGRISGILNVRDESDLKEPVRIVIDLKKDADPDVVLNQLYKFTPLQDSFSIILLALVDGKPRTLSLKE